MRFNINKNKQKLPKYALQTIFTVTKGISPIFKKGDVFYNDHGRLINSDETIVLPNRRHIRAFMEIGTPGDNNNDIDQPGETILNAGSVQGVGTGLIKPRNKYILRQGIAKLLQISNTEFTQLDDRVMSLNNKYIFKITQEILKAFLNNKKQ